MKKQVGVVSSAKTAFTPGATDLPTTIPPTAGLITAYALLPGFRQDGAKLGTISAEGAMRPGNTGRRASRF